MFRRSHTSSYGKNEPSDEEPEDYKKYLGRNVNGYQTDRFRPRRLGRASTRDANYKGYEDYNTTDSKIYRYDSVHSKRYDHNFSNTEGYKDYDDFRRNKYEHSNERSEKKEDRSNYNNYERSHRTGNLQNKVEDIHNHQDKKTHTSNSKYSIYKGTQESVEQKRIEKDNLDSVSSGDKKTPNKSKAFTKLLLSSAKKSGEPFLIVDKLRVGSVVIKTAYELDCPGKTCQTSRKVSNNEQTKRPNAPYMRKVHEDCGDEDSVLDINKSKINETKAMEDETESMRSVKRKTACNIDWSYKMDKGSKRTLKNEKTKRPKTPYTRKEEHEDSADVDSILDLPRKDNTENAAGEFVTISRVCLPTGSELQSVNPACDTDKDIKQSTKQEKKRRKEIQKRCKKELKRDLKKCRLEDSRKMKEFKINLKKLRKEAKAEDKEIEAKRKKEMKCLKEKEKKRRAQEKKKLISLKKQVATKCKAVVSKSKGK